MSTKRMLLTVLAAGAVLLALVFGSQLAGVLVPITLADEGVWGHELTSPSFMYRLGAEVQISTPSTPLDAHRHLPAVVHNRNHKEYLVVWHNEWPGSRDIYAQRVSESGAKIGGWFCITTGAKDRFQPALAYSATDDEYLIVWMQEDDTRANVYNIRGRIIAWNNSYQRPEFTIITWANRSFWTPRVAWNSVRNEYFVVWNAFDTTINFPPGVPNDIAGSRVTNENGGKVIATHMLAFPTDSGPHQVDIAYNVAMNEYLMVCVIVHTEVSSGNDIYGRRVGWDGTLYPWIEIFKDDYASGRKHQNHPAVTTNEQDKYMVVWEHQYTSTDHDIYGREYNANGTPVISYFISVRTEDDTVPDVAANGASKEWLVVWQRKIGSGGGYSIRGCRWGSDGSGVYTYFFDVINWTFYECQNPAVAADIPGYLIVYEELPPPGPLTDSANLTTYRHIYGRMWWPEAAYLPIILRNK